MVILIGGSTHTGKTLLAQKMVEKYHYSCLSLDHLKMGLIRSGHTTLTPYDDDKMTDFLWPIVSEMIKTVIENEQNIIIEGCYFPYDWKSYFEQEYLAKIKMVFLVFDKEYIETHFEDIRSYGSVIEDRGEDEDCTKEVLLRDNELCLEMCRQYGCEYHLVTEQYDICVESIMGEE